MSEKWIDRAWKSVLTEIFDDALIFFMPNLNAIRDFTRPVEMRSEEQPKIHGKSDKGMRISDAIFTVPIIGGDKLNIAFVIEQQHSHDDELPLRMFQTYYRTLDKMNGEPVTSLAILTGNIKEVSDYNFACQGTGVNFWFNSYSVAKADIDALRRDERVFAPVALAAALMLKANGNPIDREKYTRELMRLMGERKYSREKMKAIFRFIGNIFQVYKDDISRNLREEWNMIAIPLGEAVEKIRRECDWEQAWEEGMEEGIKKGIEKGAWEKARDMAKNLLAAGVPKDIIASGSGLSIDEINALGA